MHPYFYSTCNGNAMGKILCRNPGGQVTPVAPTWGCPCFLGLPRFLKIHRKIPGLFRTWSFKFQDFPVWNSFSAKFQDFPGGVGSLEQAFGVMTYPWRRRRRAGRRSGSAGRPRQTGSRRTPSPAGGHLLRRCRGIAAARRPRAAHTAASAATSVITAASWFPRQRQTLNLTGRRRGRRDGSGRHAEPWTDPGTCLSQFTGAATSVRQSWRLPVCPTTKTPDRAPPCELDPPYDIKLAFELKVTSVLRKSTQTAALLTLICTESFVGWGFAPDPLGELTARPQTP